MQTRYAVTHIATDGVRVLTRANQGRNHFDTRAEAETWMNATKASLRAKVLGDGADTLRVLTVTCYDHGDCTRTVFRAWPRHLDATDKAETEAL